MQLIWVVLVGMVVGAFAKLIMIPGKDPGGVLVTMVVGIAGSAFAYMIGRAGDWYLPDEASGFLASILGAVVLLSVYRLIVGRPYRTA